MATSRDCRTNKKFFEDVCNSSKITIIIRREKHVNLKGKSEREYCKRKRKLQFFFVFVSGTAHQSPAKMPRYYPLKLVSDCISNMPSKRTVQISVENISVQWTVIRRCLYYHHYNCLWLCDIFFRRSNFEGLYTFAYADDLTILLRSKFCARMQSAIRIF